MRCPAWDLTRPTRLCEYRLTFSWRLWTLLNSSITVPCVCMRKCLDPTEMPLRYTTDVFFSLISNSAEPWGLEVGNGTQARRETAPSFSSFLSPGRYLPLFSLSAIISCSVTNFLKATVGYSSSQEKGLFGRPKSSEENQSGREPSVGLKWGDTGHFLFLLGMLSFVFENWDKANTPWAASCCTSSHRLPPTDFQIRPASPTVPNPGNRSWYKCHLKSQNKKKEKKNKQDEWTLEVWLCEQLK